MTVRQSKTLPPLPSADIALMKLSNARQQKLDDLMSRNNNGVLTADEKRELIALVGAAEALTLENARALATHQRHGQAKN